MADQFELPLFEQQPLEHPAELTRTFLGWDHPLLPLAVEHLTRHWRGGTLDLSDHLVVVPTRQAGRRLRSALAIRASERDAGALPPQVVTPDYLLSAACLPGVKKAVATRPETLIAWAEVLFEANLDDFRAVFPIEPIERNVSWALRTAEDLIAVQNDLGEAGLTIKEAAKQLAADGIEPQRWADLSRLERRTRRLLTKRNRLTPQAIRHEAAHKGALDEHIKALVVLGLPDPPPLFCAALKHHLAMVSCEIAIHAPASLAETFDEFGRPIAEAWIDRPIELPDLENTIHQAANPDGQAHLTVELLGQPDHLAAVAAIGAPDQELLLPLEEAFAARGQKTFNPAGEPAITQALPALLRTLYQVSFTQSFLSLLELLRHPGAAESARCWQAEGRPEIDSATLLGDLDEFQRDHVPESLDAAGRINQSCQRSSVAVTRAHSWIQSWLRRFEGENLWSTLPEFLGEIYSNSEFEPGNPFDEAFTAVSNLLHGILDSLEAGLLDRVSLGEKFTDQLRLVLHLLERETIYTDHKPGTALELQGWLELPWEDAPHLVVTGMNDGSVPEATTGHAFLPDSARRLLGLRHNGDRHARDAFLLSALLACRRDHGRVDLVFGRLSASEEPLRPSRLLFACPPDDLARRVQLFFDTPVRSRASPAWSLSWQFKPPAPHADMPIFARLPATGFRDYLACPFRFYLRRGLRMERDDGPLVELDARRFGTLCHLVVEEFAASPLRESDREEEIASFFDDTLSGLIQREFGSRLPVPVLVQSESARQRLRWWAAIEAEQRRQGWEIVECERPLDTDQDPWIVQGIRITGKIDRVERHAADNLVRVLDFKTGQAKPPHDAHIRRLRRHEDPGALPVWNMVPGAKPLQRWTDLQLPLYLLALQRESRSECIQAGYANLGRARSEVSLQVWEDLDDSLLVSARQCAEGVLESIAAHKFWPPADRVDYDEFSLLLLGDPLRSVDPGNLVSAP